VNSDTASTARYASGAFPRKLAISSVTFETGLRPSRGSTCKRSDESYISRVRGRSLVYERSSRHASTTSESVFRDGSIR
jgi:hypothetical protein